MKIVCFGDSLTSCGGPGGRYSDMLQKSLPQYRIINSGKGGDTIGGGLDRLDQAVLQHHAQYLIVGLGANDYWQRKRTLNELKKDYDAILSRCTAAGMKIVVISCFGNEKLPPGRIIDFDRAGLPLEHYAAGLAVIERELVGKYHAEYVPDMQCGITPQRPARSLERFQSSECRWQPDRRRYHSAEIAEYPEIMQRDGVCCRPV